MLSQWTKWNASASRGRYKAEVELIYEDYFDPRDKFGDHYVIFILHTPEDPSLGLQATDYQFMLGLTDEGELSGELVADLSGSCPSPILCKWTEEMGQVVLAAAEDNDLALVLNSAIKIYSELQSQPKSYRTTRVIKKNSVSISKFISEIRSNPLVTVKPITASKWNLTVKGLYTSINCIIDVTSGPTGYSYSLRVLSPRLALGGNVSFGGSCSSTISHASIPHVLNEVVRVLSEEVPFSEPTYAYTPEEYEASVQASTVDCNYVGSMQALVSPIVQRDNSSVLISRTKFGSMLSERSEYLWLKLSNPERKRSVWLVAQPEDIPEGIIWLPDTALANLQCKQGDKIIISRGDLPLVQETDVEIRLRDDSHHLQEVIKYIEGMSSLTVGCTYYCATTGTYFDVLSAGQQGACSLRTRADVQLRTSRPLIERADPLAVVYSSDEEESE